MKTLLLILYSTFLFSQEALLIINNNGDLQTKYGAKRIITALSTKGFNVKVLKNENKQNIITSLRQLSCYNTIVIYIMSHGAMYNGSQVFRLSDGTNLFLYEIYDELRNNSQLKFLFVNACRVNYKIDSIVKLPVLPQETFTLFCVEKGMLASAYMIKFDNAVYNAINKTSNIYDIYKYVSDYLEGEDEIELMRSGNIYPVFISNLTKKNLY